jgi:hypothetical protein
LTGRVTARVATGQIYRGAVPFVLIQILMVGLPILFPQMVMVYKGITSTVDPSKIKIELPSSEMEPSSPTPPTIPGAPPYAQEEQQEENDAAK